jgi:hypothetical protein
LELIEFLRAEAQEGQRMLDIALSGLDDTVANWQPPGTANSIGHLLAHVVSGQDQAINVVLGGGQSVFEAGNWSAQTGMPADRRGIWGQDWRLKVAGFLDYREAVRSSLNAYLESMNLSDLDRQVPWARGEQSAWWLVRTIFINHVLGHAGEISALKGIQGLKGLPF